MHDLKIDPEFQEKIPPLTKEEYEQLKENILEAGEVYQPIIVWKGTIVDGHNRWKIIQENPGLIYRIREMDFTDKWAAFDWMYKNQLGRRNLTEAQRKYLLGKLFEARKHCHGGNRGNRYTSLASPENQVLLARARKTSRIIAREFGIGHSTVELAEKFANGVDAVRTVSPETADAILSGEKKVAVKDIVAVLDAKPEERERMVSNIREGKRPIEVSVPKQMVDRPRDRYTGGGTKDYREQRSKIAETVAEMYDTDATPEYTVDSLKTEITWNAKSFINMLNNLLNGHMALVRENAEAIKALLDETIIHKVEAIKGALVNE